MMENNPTPSPEPVPEAAPITVPVPAESAVTPPPAPPVIPLRERPNAPLLHKGFQNLFRLGIANIVINLLNNTFKLGDKIPALGVVLSVVSLAVSILTLVVLWKLSAAIPRFRNVVYLNLFRWSCFPLPRLSDFPACRSGSTDPIPPACSSFWYSCWDCCLFFPRSRRTTSSPPAPKRLTAQTTRWRQNGVHSAPGRS